MIEIRFEDKDLTIFVNLYNYLMIDRANKKCEILVPNNFLFSFQYSEYIYSNEKILFKTSSLSFKIVQVPISYVETKIDKGLVV